MPCRGRVQFLPLPLFPYFLTGRCSFGGSLLQSVLYMWSVTIYVMCAGGGCGFPSSNGKSRWDGMGGLGTTPSIESVRCCGIAVNLQETPPLATRFGLFRGPATLSRICSHFVLCSPVDLSVRRGRPCPHVASPVPKMMGPFWRYIGHIDPLLSQTPITRRDA